jgi:hypothetical protein
MTMVFIYLIMIVVPGIFVFVTIKRIIKAKYIQKHGMQTQGLIKQITSVRHGSSNFDHLLLEYQDGNGQYHTAKVTVFQGQYQRGHTMRLHYLQHKPSQYSIDGLREGHIGILLICAAMLRFMIFASYKLSQLAEATNIYFSP